MQLKPIRFYLRFFAVAVLLSVVLLVISGFLPERSLTARILDELGIALVIAAILAAGIETYARMRFEDELKRGVVEAIYKRMIPPLVFDQVREHILKANIVRKNYRLTLKLNGKLPDEDRPDQYESETSISYDIFNITGLSPDCTITHGLDHDLSYTDKNNRDWPRFTSVKIGDALYDEPALSRHIRDYRLTIKTKLPKADHPLHVEIKAASIVKAPDTCNWNMSNLAEGATIEIVVDPAVTGIGFDVKALHPERSMLNPQKRNGQNGAWKWVFEPALLPWQGFEFRSFLMPVVAAKLSPANGPEHPDDPVAPSPT
jgi:hypothetical protein